MKVLFVFQGLTDTPNYYSHVLQRMHDLPDVELTVAFGWERAKSDDKRVPQHREGFTYAFVDLDDQDCGDGHRKMPDLWRHICQIRPDVVVTTPEYLQSFRTHLPLRAAMCVLRTPLILKSIPFRVPTSEEFRETVRSRYRRALETADQASTGVLGSLRRRARRTLVALKIHRILRRQTSMWIQADGHVNYTEDAYSVYGSYGVPRERIFIIRNSPDTELLREIHENLVANGARSNPHRIIHVGRLVQWKRVDLLLHAFARVKRFCPEAELLVVGDGPMATDWQALAGELGVADAVEFVGGVYAPEDLGRLLISSAAYVLAGMGGISLNDAMSFGVPVVCSVCDGTERALVKNGQNGLVFRDGDADDLADKILMILHNAELRASLATGALQTVRREINVWTVLDGYLDAFEFVTRREMKVTRAAIAAKRARLAGENVV